VSVRARLILNGTLILLIGFFAVNTFLPESVRAQSSLLPDQGMRLGLDLRGGIHWVIGVKLERALEQELDYLRGSLEDRLREEKVEGVTLRVAEGRLSAEVFREDAREKVREFAGDTDVLREVPGDAAGALVYEISPDWQREVRERAMQQVLEVLRNRVEDPAKGIAESVVTRQGDDRVLVQIPGGEVDRQAARDLLEVTGFLEFKLVRDHAPSEELLVARHPGGLPEGSEVALEKEKETGRVIGAYLVDDKAALTGQYLADARVGFDNRQRPLVHFRFTPEGGEIFGELTGENVGKQLAILLDDEVKSAPVVRSRISMQGQIEGRFTTEEASDLAIVLRAGSLSVPVVIEEERTVGPALGADSIRNGVRAAVIGSALVVLFMVGYYRVSGVFASVAVLLNLLLTIGLMSLPELPGTLTLPGIAGLVLTVGMTVDGNVIIFERIREELRAGKIGHAAVDTGYHKSLWTILDANVTTLLVGLVLYQYGTGPIKGFAVTLMIGIITGVWTSVALTRLMMDIWLRRRPGAKTLSI
jgi:preprotein translocase subunit SecD